tara:strand:- start:3550 stop:4515 length:966 start_codon:yes stop_codon:yes gene_type:complete
MCGTSVHLLALPNEIILEILRSRVWTVGEVFKLTTVCKLFDELIRGASGITVAVSGMHTRSLPFMKIYDLNPRCQVIADMKHSSFPAPLWSDMPLKCKAINFSWVEESQNGRDTSITSYVAREVASFLDGNRGNEIKLKYPEADIKVIIKHGDSPQDYKNIQKVCRALGKSPKVLSYEKNGPFLALPEFDNERFTEPFEFPSVKEFVLKGFSFGDFLRIKGHARLPCVPNAEMFHGTHFINPHPELGNAVLLKGVTPLLARGDYYVYNQNKVINRKYEEYALSKMENFGWHEEESSQDWRYSEEEGEDIEEDEDGEEEGAS